MGLSTSFLIKMLSKSILFLNSIGLIQATTYYCTSQLTDQRTNQASCPPAAGSTSATQTLTLYNSIKRCCSDDRSDIPNGLVILRMPDKPPQELPEECVLGLHRNDGKLVCTSAHPIGYNNWHASVMDTQIIICCSKVPTTSPLASSAHKIDQQQLIIDEKPSKGITTPTGSADQANGGIVIPAPPPAPQPQPLRPPVPAVSCRDLSVPGMPSDCPSNQFRCDLSMWRNLMRQQCPFTCNVNGCANGARQQQSQSSFSFSDRHIGGGRGCRDWIPPAGHMSCDEMIGLDYCLKHRTQMMAQCPVKCGFC